MNGIISSPKKAIQILKLRFSLAILISNLSLAILLWPSKRPLIVQSNPKKLRPGHNLITLPLKNFVPFQTGQKEVAVSLYSDSKKIIVPKAYVKSKKISSSNNENIIFLVELPSKYLLKIIELNSKSLFAYPPSNILKTSKKRKYNYEFIF